MGIRFTKYNTLSTSLHVQELMERCIVLSSPETLNNRGHRTHYEYNTIEQNNLPHAKTARTGVVRIQVFKSTSMIRKCRV